MLDLEPATEVLAGLVAGVRDDQLSAAASGQPFLAEPHLIEAAYGFVQASAGESPDGTPGLFGPPVPVPADAPLLDRLIGLSGRDPSWRTSSA